MIDIKVIGHKIPDTDCTLSAIIFAEYLNMLGDYKAIPYIQGKLNKETAFLLQILHIETPEIKTNFKKGTSVALVDHNENTQSLDNINELNIEFLIDHHKIDFSNSIPMNIRMEKLCSTCSVLYKMFKEKGFKISEKIGTLILAGILSDSLLFKSATTTKEDISIANELKKITKIENFKDFAIPMFEAKSDLGNISTYDLIKYDYKEFELNGNKIGVGTIETTNPDYTLNRKDDILIEMQNIKKQDGLNFIILSVVDIIGEQNITITLDGIETTIIEEVFNTKVEFNQADLKKRLSRKKQILPDLTNYFLNK